MKLAVIILNWNGKNDTLACLASLIDAPLFETIVVDNGSSDDSVIEISKKIPTVTLLQTHQNLGYAGGNNVGIEYALKQGADSVLLLNNDTVVDHRFISALVAAAKKHAIVGAYPLRFSDPTKLDHLGGVWNSSKASFDLIGQNASDGFTTDQPLDYVCGCSILIHRKVFETIGLLEPAYFLFWEEADFCVRAKKAGFSLGVCYEARLFHKISASFTGSPQKTYFWWRGRFLWIERNCSPEEKTRLYKTVLLPELRHFFKLRILKSLQLLFRSKNHSEKKIKLLQYRAALAAYRDFRKARFGDKYLNRGGKIP